MPRLVELLGWQALGAHLAAVQSSMLGLLYYGLLVFCMEFVPVGGINPKEVAEYLGLVGGS
jgi:2-keto-3-deoxy-6-phosphogluconate aldolase